jgi:hypothetical protein
MEWKYLSKEIGARAPTKSRWKHSGSIAEGDADHHSWMLEKEATFRHMNGERAQMACRRYAGHRLSMLRS